MNVALNISLQPSILERVLGCANFFHTHIPDYATWSSDLYECTANTFNWNHSTWKKDYRALFEKFKAVIENSVSPERIASFSD